MSEPARAALPNDRFYRATRAMGRLGMCCVSRATVLHAERTDLEGPWILAANHVSPYDIVPIIRSCRRVVDFVSITEVFAVPWLRWLCGNMGAFPINRQTLDVQGLRVIYERLAAGRVIGIFPEGALGRGEERTILQGAAFKSGVGKLAYTANAPVVPCVHVDTTRFGPPHRWLPLRLIRYGIIFGQALECDRSLPRKAAAKKLEHELALSMQALYAELSAVYWRTAERPGT